MSLYDSNDYGPPEIQAYRRRGKIAELDWCPQCKGLGTQRVQHSGSGLDWRICRECHGSGKAPVTAAEAKEESK